MRFVVGIAHHLNAIEPTRLIDASRVLLARAVFDTPFLPSGTGPKPRLLEPLQRETSTKYFATVLPSARFSDGNPVTPDDVVAACQSLSGVRTRRDGARLVFELEAPDNAFHLRLAYQPLISRTTSKGFIGTGPFVVHRHSRTEVVMKPNAYSSTQPVVQELVFRACIAPDGSNAALTDALVRGDIDYAPRLTWADLAHLDDTLVKLTRPVNSVAVMHFNTERLPEAALRRALAAAIDPLEVMRGSFGDAAHGFVASHWVPSALGTFKARTFHAPSTARKLVKNVTVPTRTLELATIFLGRPYLPDPAQSAHAAVAGLASIGVNARVEVPSSPEAYQARTERGDYDLLLTGNLPETEDAVEFIDEMSGSARVPESGRVGACFNFSRLRSAELDRALTRWRSERTDERLAAVEQVLLDEMPYVPLGFGRAISAHRRSWRGIEPTASVYVDFAQISHRKQGVTSLDT